VSSGNREEKSENLGMKKFANSRKKERRKVRPKDALLENG
jgi:hypothetical protein